MKKTSIFFILSCTAFFFTKSSLATNSKYFEKLTKNKNTLKKILIGEKNLTSSENIDKIVAQADDLQDKLEDNELLDSAQIMSDIRSISSDIKKEIKNIETLKEKLEDFRERNKGEYPEISGYGLTTSLFSARKSIEKAKHPKAKEVFEQIKKEAKNIVEKWITKLKTIRKELQSTTRKKIINLLQTNFKQAAVLEEKINNGREISKNLEGVKPFTRDDLPYKKSAREKELSTVNLLDEIGLDKSKKELALSLIKSNKPFMEKLSAEFSQAEKINLANKEKINLANKIVKKLNIQQVNNLEKLKIAHKNAKNLISSQDYAVHNILNNYISKTFQPKAIELAKKYRKPLDEEKNKIKIILEKNNFEIDNLEKTVENFNQMILDKLGNKNYDYCIFRVMNSENRSDEQDETMGYFEFIGKAQKILEQNKIKKETEKIKYKDWEDVI